MSPPNSPSQTIVPDGLDAAHDTAKEDSPKTEVAKVADAGAGGELALKEQDMDAAKSFLNACSFSHACSVRPIFGLLNLLSFFV